MLLESIPFRVFTSSRRPGRRAPGPASSRFFAPSTTSPGLAPSAAVRPVPLRFRSQVFSTSQRFPGMSGLRGLVSCRCRPWGFPCGALLLAGIACSSRSRLLPCSSPPPYLRCDARDRVLRVSPPPARSRGGLDPHRSSDTVSAIEHRSLSLAARAASRALAHGPDTASSLPWTSCTGVTSFRRLRLLRSFPPPASPCPRRAAFADAPRPVLPWALPLQSFDSDRASDPCMTQRTIPSAAR
jgi:hypothetical protein